MTNNPSKTEDPEAWRNTIAVLEKYPEARRFMECRKKWMQQHIRCEILAKKAETARAKESRMWAEMQALKDALPEEVKDAIC